MTKQETYAERQVGLDYIHVLKSLNIKEMDFLGDQSQFIAIILSISYLKFKRNNWLCQSI
ncbi:hypothetical protein ABDD95_20410 [Mucilaginibacter sp. PAMB04274]|uniref:hypothetical protein n=1 Tax=Mucilaginibacter sp. PAMB04274 TaxID=3138568 RepID=UPI0031F6F112